MSTDYTAGTAKLFLSPKLAADFTAQVKKLLAPINESLSISLKPQLATGFKTQVASLVKTAADGVDAKVSVSAKLGVGFRADLESQVKKAAAGVNATVEVKASTRGIKSQIKAGTQDLPDLKLKLDLSGATRQLEQFRTLVSASPLSMSVNIDSKTAMAQIAALRSLAASAGDSINASNGSVSSSSSAAKKLTGNIFTRPVQAVKLQVQIDKASAAKAEADVAAIGAKLTAARQTQADATDKLNIAEARYSETMAKSGVSESRRLSVTQSLAKARRDLSTSTSHVESLSSDADRAARAIKPNNGRSSAGSVVSAAFTGLTSAALDGLKNAATSAFSLSNVLGLAQAALVGLAAVSLVPLIGQLVQAAGVVALLPAAVAGAVAVFATLKIGVSGVSDAFKAAGKMASDSGKEAQDQAKAIASAQKDEATAAQAVGSAQQNVVEAERGVGDAQRESASAQRDLTTARKDATRQLQDLNTELGRSKLDEEGAAISVAEAQRDLVKTLSDPNADAIDRASAQHRLNEALADQQDVNTKVTRTQQDANDANARGVEGSDGVVAAKDRVQKAAEGETKAQQAVVDAQTSLVTAQTNLVASEKAVADEMTKGLPSVTAYQKAMAGLAPAAQDFVQKLLDLKPQLSDFKKSIQEGLFDKLGDSASTFITHWLPSLKDGFTGIATEINTGVRGALADLDNDANRSTVSGIFDNIKASIVPVIQGIDNLVQGLLSLTGVGSSFLPGLSNSFLGLTEKFRTWAQSPEGQTAFHDFIQRSLTAFGQISDLLTQIGRLIGSVFSGSDPTGKSWVQSLTDGAKKWADFLGTPEGQKKIQDFFNNVKQIVEDIAGAIKDAAGIAKGIKSVAGSGPTAAETEANAPRPGGGALNGAYNFMNDSEIPTLPGQTPFDTILMGEKGQLKDWWNDIKTGLTGAAADVGIWSTGVKQSFDGVLSDTRKTVASWVGDIKGWWLQLATDASNAFDKFTGAFKGLPAFFGQIVSDVGASWGNLGSKLTGPVNAVIDVLNEFGALWNKAASFIGLPNTWTVIPHVGAQAAPTANGGGGGDAFFGPSANGGGGGDGTFATGGLVSGGTPGKDSVQGLLMPGEVVMSVPAVRAAGESNLLAYNNAALQGSAPTEGMFSGRVAMATGGAVNDAIDKAQQFAESQAGKPYQYGGVGDPSWDCSGLWSGIVNVLQGNSPTTPRLFTTESDFPSMGWTPGLTGPVTVGIMRGGGGEDSHMAGTLNGVNAESRGGDGVLYGDNARGSDNQLFGLQYTLQDFIGKYKSGGNGGSMLGNVVNAGKNALIDKVFATPLRNLVKTVPSFDNLGAIGQIPSALISKVVDGAIGFVKDKTNIGGGGSTAAAGTGPVVDQVQSAFAKYGWGSGAEWNAASWIIQHESGFNPAAVNPSSGAFGIAQFLGSTKDQYLPDSNPNPAIQGDAMARYIKDRYGDPKAAQAFWASYNWYDQGGIFPNNTLGINTSGLPEAVLTNPQWKLFQDFAGNLPHDINPAIPGPAVDPNANFSGIPGATDALANPGVDTGATLAAKGVSRFKDAFNSGLNDMISANLGPLGIPDPRSIPAVSAATDYGNQLSAWQQAKAAGVQATQMLAQTGYTGVPTTAGTTAEAATGQTSSAGGVVNNDNSTTINIQTADVDSAFRKAQQISDLRALSVTARDG